MISMAELIALRHQAHKWKLFPPRTTTSLAHGQFSSRFKGRGMDFEEVRHYQPGDDIRHMDWKVTARVGKAHVKLYQEERERPVFMVVDYRATMFFGSRVCFKAILAARVAALLAWAAASNHDRVGGFVFAEDSHHECRPDSGKRGAIQLIRTLVDHARMPEGQAQGSLSMEQALKRLRYVARPGSLVFLLSDFIGWGEETEQHVARLRQHNEVVAIHIADPLERELPPPGSYNISDGQRIMSLDSRDKKKRQDFHVQFETRKSALEATFRKYGMPNCYLQTDNTSYADDIRRLLRG